MERRIGRVAVTLLVLGAITAACRLGREAPARPNLVLICIDAVRRDTFRLPESAGLEDSFTPWMQRAIRFENAYTVSSWTLPAVASVLTGLMPGQHGAGSFEQPAADLNVTPPSGLAGSIPALPGILEGHGYQTIHLTRHPWTADPAFGLAQRFSHVERSRAPLESALEWMQRCRRLCFVSAHLLTVHEYGRPLEEVRRTAAEMAPGLKEAAAASMPEPLRDGPEDAALWYLEYVRRVAETREKLASFLDGLQRLGALEQSVIVVYSDHGEEFGEHGQGGHGKSLFQETLRVPLLAWVPGAEGQSVESPASLIDLLPSTLHWLGLPPPSEVTGLNLAERIEAGDRDALQGRAVFASGIAYGNDAAAVVQGRWKLIYDRVSGESRIYDLEADPAEQRPLASAPSELEGDLLAAIEQLDRLPVRGLPTPVQPDPKLLERLESLGYLSGASR